MKKHFQLHGSIVEAEIVPNYWSLELDFLEEDVQQLALHLLLLDYNLIQLLIINAEGCKQSLCLSMASTGNSTIKRAGLQRQIELSRNSLQYFAAFLLRYFSDGFAPVNHIDIELQMKDGTLGDYNFMVRTAKCAAPLTLEEAKRLIDLE